MGPEAYVLPERLNTRIRVPEQIRFQKNHEPVLREQVGTPMAAVRVCMAEGGQREGLIPAGKDICSPDFWELVREGSSGAERVAED